MYQSFIALEIIVKQCTATIASSLLMFQGINITEMLVFNVLVLYKRYLTPYILHLKCKSFSEHRILFYKTLINQPYQM